MFRRSTIRYGKTPEPETPYQRAAQVWDDRIGSARVQARSWRLAFFGTLALSSGLAGGIVWQGARGTIVPWVVQVDKFGEAQAVAPATADYNPTDPQIAFHLARFIEQVRSIPSDPIIVRENWLRAYDFTTDKGALALNDYARANDPFANIGKVQVAVDVTSVIRASATSFRIAWVRAPLSGRSARRHDPLVGDPDRHHPDPTNPRRDAQKPARPVRQRHQLVEGTRIMINPLSCVGRGARCILLLSVVTLHAGMVDAKPASRIDLANAIQARPQDEPASPVTVVAIPVPLPLPDQLKPVSRASPLPAANRARSADPRSRVGAANDAARVRPERSGFINAIQQYAYADGALYQLYAAPGQITDIALQEGEQLVGTGPVAAGDTVRWLIGDTTSGTGPAARVHILVKPTRADLATNLIINTDRRTYHIEMRANPATYMASVSWTYPQDELIAVRRANAVAAHATPVAAGIDLSALNFGYVISGDKPSWKPLRAFDDGVRVIIEFPDSIAQGDMPPLFVIGPSGQGELVNYRVSGHHMIVDRLFAAVELRLGDKHSMQKVRIVRAGAKVRR
jgi:type IV secretion system protein TrbG